MKCLDIRPVYKTKHIERAFKNTLYFFVKYTTDCPICLSFFNDPQVLPCGHCYCHTCILRSVKYSKICPMCADFFWIYKPAKFFFVEEIRDQVLLRRCCNASITNSQARDFFDQPHSLEYFQEIPESSTSGRIELVSHDRKHQRNHEFYQSDDGQLYFLDPKVVRSFKSKPEYIFCNIKTRHECFVNYCKYPELSHVPSGIKVVILLIC